MLSQHPTSRGMGESLLMDSFENWIILSPFNLTAKVLWQVIRLVSTTQFSADVNVLSTIKDRSKQRNYFFNRNQCGFEYTQPIQGGGLIPKVDAIPVMPNYVTQHCNVGRLLGNQLKR